MGELYVWFVEDVVRSGPRDSPDQQRLKLRWLPRSVAEGRARLLEERRSKSGRYLRLPEESPAGSDPQPKEPAKVDLEGYKKATRELDEEARRLTEPIEQYRVMGGVRIYTRGEIMESLPSGASKIED